MPMQRACEPREKMWRGRADDHPECRRGPGGRALLCQGRPTLTHLEQGVALHVRGSRMTNRREHRNVWVHVRLATLYTIRTSLQTCAFSDSLDAARGLPLGIGFMEPGTAHRSSVHASCLEFTHGNDRAIGGVRECVCFEAGSSLAQSPHMVALLLWVGMYLDWDCNGAIVRGRGVCSVRCRKVLGGLEQQMSELHIESYGVSVTTLEEAGRVVARTPHSQFLLGAPSNTQDATACIGFGIGVPAEGHRKSFCVRALMCFWCACICGLEAWFLGIVCAGGEGRWASRAQLSRG